MATKKSKKIVDSDNSFRDLVARLNAMSNQTPEQERANLMEQVGQAPKVLDDKEVTLSDIAKLAGIKEYVEPVKHSKEAEKLVESIVAEPKEESSITKAIKESDADDSISTSIKKEVNEEVKRLDKIAELETQLAELKAAEKEDATMDDKAFREAFTKEITEYAKKAEASELVEIYNKFSMNEVEMNENNFTIKTPETAEIIADAEKAEAPEEEVIADAEKDKPEPSLNDLVKQDAESEVEDETNVPGRKYDKDDEEEAKELKDEGEEVELDAVEPAVEIPQEDKFTNDLDPTEKK